MSNLFRIKNIEECAVILKTKALNFRPIEGLDGWSLLLYTDEESGTDFIALQCKADAIENPLHSGGDVTWLGFAEEGPVKLTLGDKDGKMTSCQVIEKGDFFIFEPDTYHGWIPMDHEAKLIFIQLKA